MSLSLKAGLVVLGFALLVLVTHEAVLRLTPPPPDPHQLGLAWLKAEYRVPDEAFAKISVLHEEYFARCDAMCAQMLGAHRPALPRTARNLGPRDAERLRQQAAAAAREREKALCESCLGTMVAHLEAVAALMPAVEGERFLKDLLPELVNPRELQDLRASSRPVQ
jgi:hypothetical protein